MHELDLSFSIRWTIYDFNRYLEQYLRALTSHAPCTWYSFLGWVEFHFNTSFQTTQGMNPFEAIYGRSPPSNPTYILCSTSVQAVDEVAN